MLWPVLLLAIVTLQRLSELLIARRNAAALIAQGAVEHGRAHYPVMVVLHAAWLAVLWFWGWNSAIHIGWLAVYGVLQLLRIWILATLGRRWTTRVLTLPGETLVRDGPYRLLRHPNYALVALEVPVLPLALGLAHVAVLFGLLNIAMLAWRMRVEDKALAPARHAGVDAVK
jgi:methyltransferase